VDAESARVDPTFSRFDAAARQVVVAAQRTAAGAGEQLVSVRLLLAAVAAVDPALVDFVLGSDAGWWRRLAGPPSSILPATHNLPWDDDAQQALRAAVSQSDWEARRDAHTDGAPATVTPEHLLIGALGAPPTMAVLQEWDVPVGASVARARVALGPRPVAVRAVRRGAPLVAVRHTGPDAGGGTVDDHALTLDRARRLDARRTPHPGQRPGATDDELAACVVHFTDLVQAFPHDHLLRLGHLLALAEQGPWDEAADVADAAVHDPEPLVRSAVAPIADLLLALVAVMRSQPLGHETSERISASLTGPEPWPWPPLPAVRAETAALLALQDGRPAAAVGHLDRSDPDHASTLALALFRTGERATARSIATAALARALGGHTGTQGSRRSDRRWAHWVNDQMGA
jgi:hypothetical protein